GTGLSSGPAPWRLRFRARRGGNHMVATTEDLSPDTRASGSGAGHELPPPAAMMGLITGYWVSQAVGVVAHLGVADHLEGGPRTSDDLAGAVGADPRALHRVLRLLASIGVFSEVAPGTYGLTPLGATLRSHADASGPDIP